MPRSCKDIRSEFIAFFEHRGHAFVPSSPLLPAADPTLLFANAGMNQFKDIFLGKERRDYSRAVNTQKCIRAGGKHNDLEDVGHDCYHHTFFEMLGNWSFGDYFKVDAIAWAWELLTEVWKLPADRLHATYFQGDKKLRLDADDESRELWGRYLPAERIHPGDRKDNFWEMGEVGPCGPCSEIHIDLTDDGSGAALVNASDPRVIEIWNLVFMQYSRSETGELTELPAKHVDTGMGLERLCAVMNGKKSNYATDLFIPIIEKIETLTEHRYGMSNPESQISNFKSENPKSEIRNSESYDRFDARGREDLADVACRVIADHARALTFAIADGVNPSNEGRGYVLRRILRRAARYGRQYLDISGPFIVELVPTVVALMGETFSEIVEREKYVVETIRREEESFGRTLDRGIELFQKHAGALRKAGEKILSGEVAFDLYATYGFPVDLTQIMAEEVGLKVDIDGYRRAMEAHRQTSSAGGGKFKAAEIPDLPETDDSAKYVDKSVEAKVLGWVVDETYCADGELVEGTEAAVVLDRTNFYAEQGGQVGDSGELMGETFVFDVQDTKLSGKCVLHVGKVRHGTVRPGLSVTATVCPHRIGIRRNHTATHLLNWALREVLGEHVTQAGSVVSSERLRFDFSHNRAVSADQLERVERMVNEMILADRTVSSTIMPISQARNIPGVRAVFGEKYPDPVRVISIGTSDPLNRPSDATTIEFCGGTHVRSTGAIERFRIVSEKSVAKGVRRIVAVTGRDGVEAFEKAEAERLAEKDRQKERLRMEKAARSAAAAADIDPVVSARTPHGDILVARVDTADANAMRGLCDRHRSKGAAAMMIGGAEDKKVMLVAMVSDALLADGKIKAGDWVKAVAGIVGGGGGGKDTMATAGGKSPEKLDDALEAAGEWVRSKL